MFTLSLIEPRQRTRADLSPPSAETPEDLVSVLVEICSRLQELGYEFNVQICSVREWPVDVRTDLAVIVEQLPDALDALADGREDRLEFYEQGVERVVALRNQSDGVLVAWWRLTASTASPMESAVVPRTLVAEALGGLGREFLSAANTRCGRLAQTPTFFQYSSWLKDCLERLMRWREAGERWT